jgi:hypothetical protein
MKSAFYKILCFLFLIGHSGNLSGQIDARKKDDALWDIYAPPSNSNALKQTNFMNQDAKEKDFEDALAREIQKSIQEKELRDLKENNVLTPAQLFEKRCNAETWRGKKQYAIIDKDLGVLENSTQTITIVCRDFGAEDGDIVEINQNNETIVRRIQLTRSYQQFTIPLVLGVNKIAFLARNEGLYSPNTAGFMIFDQNGKTLMQNDWFLATGAKAFFTIVRIAKKQP